MKKYRVARFLKRHMPANMRKRWKKRLEREFRNRTIHSKENEKLLEEFQLRQLTIGFWGLVLFLVIFVTIFVSLRASDHISFLRNEFGQGDKEIEIQMDHDGHKEQMILTLEEKSLSKEEEEEIYNEFFQDLKKVLLGDNPSWDKVNHPLNLVDELDSYPFAITYEPEDLSLIDCNGEMGDKARALAKGKTARTRILVQASYKEYEFEKYISLTCISQEKEKLSFFEKMKQKLVLAEARSRNQDSFTIDGSEDQITLLDSSKNILWTLPCLLFLLTGLLLVKGHTDLKEEEKKRHRENMEDFPLIVHLLTLYMGAGLSFGSSVHRICQDYEEHQREKQERYAFEQTLVMDHCMNMGMRPIEVCNRWGDCFQEKVYGKFAMLLSQSFSKGARELRTMMEKEQQDAFQVQVDYVRREGEEATTKLLFPLIVLLAIIMILVMFPAIMQFYAM